MSKYVSDSKLKDIEDRRGGNSVSTTPEAKDLKDRVWDRLTKVAPAEENREVRVNQYLAEKLPLSKKEMVVLQKYYPDNWTMWLKYKKILLTETAKEQLKFGKSKMESCYKALKSRIEEWEAERTEDELENL